MDNLLAALVHSMTPIHVLAILLIEGFSTISIEILSMRSFTPFVGNSVVITSLIIGVFLLFLSLGYFRGGQVKEQFEKTLSRNFFSAALLIGVGLSVYTTSFYFWFGFTHVSKNILILLTFYLLIVIAPTVFLLGQTIPITTNMYRKNLNVSHISGHALFINTLGSFLGAVVTSLVLINFLGVACTLFINVMALMGLAIYIHQEKRRLLPLLQFSVAAVIIYGFTIDVERQLFVKTNNYGNYAVIQTPKNKIFQVNLATMSTLAENNKASPYIERIKEILFEKLGLKHKEILVIGAGGFTLNATSNYNNQFTYLDIDSQIKDIAEKHFLNRKINDRFIAQDIRAYFNQTQHQYDVIITDSYKHLNSLPAYLVTDNFFKQLKAHLKPEGIVVFNIIASPFLEDKFSKALDNTIKASFGNCLRMPVKWNTNLSNVIYTCKKTASENIKTVYTDNLNQATLDQFMVKYQ